MVDSPHGFPYGRTDVHRPDFTALQFLEVVLDRVSHNYLVEQVSDNRQKNNKKHAQRSARYNGHAESFMAKCNKCCSFE